MSKTRWHTGFSVGLLVLWTTFPAVLRPNLVTAWPRGEADNHLWMHWQSAHPGSVWSNLPEGTGIPLMDPANLPIFALGFLFGPAIAWTLALTFNSALSAIGGYLLGKELSGRQEGGWMGMAVLCGSPFLAGVGDFGLTEAWPLGWWAIHLAFLVRFHRTIHWKWAALSGAAGAAFALSGWYHVVFALLGSPIIVLLGIRQHWKNKNWWLGIAVITIISAVPSIPGWLYLVEHRSLWSHRWAHSAPVPGGHLTDWRSGPHGGGTDLVNLFLPSIKSIPGSRTVYLGWIALVLAALSLRERTGRWFVAVAVLFAILSLGPAVTVAGKLLLHLPNPVGGMTHWYRAVGPLTVALCAAAAIATPKGRLGIFLALAVVIESTFLSNAPWPRLQYDARPPQTLMELEGNGGLVLLPFDNGRLEFSKQVPRIYDRWGPYLERPLSENYEGPDTLLLRNRLIASADFLGGPSPSIPLDWKPPTAFADPNSLSKEVGKNSVIALQKSKVEWVVFIRENARQQEATRAFLSSTLGPPSVENPDFIAWRIPALQSTQ